MRTRNSVVVAGSNPSTRPTCSRSSSNMSVPGGAGDGRADPAQHELAVALEVPKTALERGDGDEVLRRPGVPERLRREPRQVRRREVGKLDCTRQRQGGAHLAPCHAGPGMAPPGGWEAEVPRV